MKPKKPLSKHSKNSKMSVRSFPSQPPSLLSIPALENQSLPSSLLVSMPSLAMSDYYLEDMGDTGILLEHDAGIVRLPSDMQTLLNCLVGVSLGVDNRWVKVPADLIISEVIEKGKKSVFAEYKEALKNYPLQFIYVGYDPGRSKADEYLVCTTEKGYISLQHVLAQEEEELYRVANKSVEPRAWKSYGSERDIEEMKLYATRQKMGMSLTLDTCARFNQPREPLTHVEPTVVELRPSAKEVFDLVEKTLFDVSVQAVPRTTAVEAQTHRAFTRHAAVQSLDDATLLDQMNDVTRDLLREMERGEDPAGQTERIDVFRARLGSRANVIQEAMHEAKVSNLLTTSADSDALMSEFGTKEKSKEEEEAEIRRETWKQVEVFAEVSSIRGKQIASIAWHPNYSGIVAVSYVNKRSTDCTVQSDDALSTDILSGTETSLSAEDSDTESMILPPIQKPGAANLAPTTSLVEENSEDETLAATEKKKLRRSSDVKVWRDRNAPPIPFLHLELSKYDTETFSYEVYEERDDIVWARMTPLKILVVDKVTSHEKLDIDGDKVMIIDKDQYAHLKKKAEHVEKLKEKGGHKGPYEQVREQEMCTGDQLRRIEETAKISYDASTKQKGQGDVHRNFSYNDLKELWKYHKNNWPFGSLLLKDLREIYLLPSDEEEDDPELNDEIPQHVLPSNLQEIKQKRSPPQKALKKLSLSVKTSLDNRKGPSLFKTALDKNLKLKRILNTVQTKVQTLAPSGADKKTQQPPLGPIRGKVVKEDPDRDPCLGVEHAVFLWSTCDSLLPLLVLDSPDEVNSLQFCPHDGNLLAGGLASGLIVIWDLTGRIDKAFSEDVSSNLNSVRRQLESELGWTKALSSDCVIKPTVISERENSHMFPVTHLQWSHPLVHMNSLGEASVKESHTSSRDFSYQLISSSLYGQLKFWDLKQDPDLIEPELDVLVRSYAEEILKRTRTELNRLNRVWKPFFTISPVQAAEKTLSVGNVNQELPTFVLSKFFVQQPRVQYRISHLSSDNKMEGVTRYQIVRDKISGLDFPRTAMFGSFSGVTCLTMWNSKVGSKELDSNLLFQDLDKLGSKDVDEESRVLWKQSYHDGPVRSLDANTFYTKVTITCGGHEWCIWHDDYENGPILWKRYPQEIACAIWSPFKPGVFFVAKNDGNIEIWDLLESNNASVGKIFVCDDPLIELSCSPHISADGSYLGVADINGTLRLFSVPEIQRQYTQEQLARFRALCDLEPGRRQYNINWNSKSHAGEPIFLTLARELEEQREAEREKEEMTKAWKFDDPVKKWAARKREVGRNKIEEKLAEQFMEHQKKVFIDAAIRKKNIDKYKMELLRKPLLKKESAAAVVQERIVQKLNTKHEEIDSITARKFPMIKEILAKPPAITPANSIPSVPSLPQLTKCADNTTNITSESTATLRSLCSGLEENTDFPASDLERNLSEEQVEAFLAKVKLFAQDVEENRLRYSDMLKEHDDLRQWLNPFKPYMDIEHWRRLRKQHELAAQKKSEPCALTDVPYDSYTDLGVDEMDEAMSNPSLPSPLTMTRPVVADLSLLTFTKASDSGDSLLPSEFQACVDAI